MNTALRSLVFWMVLVVVVVLIWNFSSNLGQAAESMPFSEFLRLVDSGQVRQVDLAATRSAALKRRVSGSGPTHLPNTKDSSTDWSSATSP